MRNRAFYILAAGTLYMVPCVALAEDTNATNANSNLPATSQAQGNPNLLNLSLQQLSDVEVTSVSKKAEKESQAPAAIYVITQEDIRRSGMQNVPELLRMVPGLQVAQSGSQNWAITSRGFDGQFGNKLLVLIDGRTVYTPVFSGVFWDVQNLMLEDIERIEVIRGPGATLWGANAVNGVINIITKSAKDTQGTLITAATGNQERVAAGGRYGGTEGNLAYRTYAQYFNQNQQHLANGDGAQDQWHNAQGGFRLDWSTSAKEITTLQGDVYKGQENSLRSLPVTAAVSPSMIRVVDDTDEVSGMNILGRWSHEIQPGSDVTLQAYYDDVLRNFENVGASFHTRTFDVDFQHNWKLNSWNEVTWGLGYREIRSGAGNSFYLSFNPESYNESLFSGFVQDKVTILPDKLFLTFGTKIEHNDFSGLEYEPSVRVSWTPTETQTVWAAVSRAVHTPNQSTQNINLILAPRATPAPFNVLAATSFLAEVGDPAQQAEQLTAYELGYRIQPRTNLSFDLTGFVNEYKDLTSVTQGSPTLLSDPSMGAYFLVPLTAGNNNSGETHGFEASATWEAAKNFKLSGNYSLYYSALHIVGASLVTKQGTSPTQQFNLRSYIDLPHNLQLDTMLYYVNALPAINIPAYTRLDMRLGWAPIPGLDVSLIGQNLLRAKHQEFSPFLYQSSEQIGRSVLVKATLRF